ncbi:MAG: hypothetical protein EPN84_13435, partial [Legionella sp.]
MFIDNVADSARTFEAAYLALGRRGFGVAFAIAAEHFPYPTSAISDPGLREALPVTSTSTPPAPRQEKPEAFSREWLQAIVRGRPPPPPAPPQPTLEHAEDDQLLNALDAFATVLLAAADLPADIAAFSFL